jgi:hypothetical protein
MSSLTSGRGSTMATLLYLLKQPEACVADVTLQFKRLHRLVESLPLTTDEFSFAHNWLTSAQQLWEAGDRHAACYQVDRVAKKLML